MDIHKETWEYLQVVAASFVTIGGLLYSVYRYIFLPSLNYIKKINKIIYNSEQILSLLKPNGGSSVIDKLSDIRKRQILNEFRTKIIFCALNVCTIEFSKDGECIWSSNKFRELTGLDLQQCLNNGWINGIAKEHREEIYNLWKELIEQKRECITKNISLYNEKTNISCPTSFSSSILKNSKNEIIGIIGVFKY